MRLPTVREPGILSKRRDASIRYAIRAGVVAGPLLLWLSMGTPGLEEILPIKIQTKASVEGSISIGDKQPEYTSPYTLEQRQDIDKTTDINTWPAFITAEGYGANATWGLKPKRAPEFVAASLASVMNPVLGLLGLVAAAPIDSICNRSGAKLHLVTNLNNSGAGSFRDIIDNQLTTDTMDYIVFRTGGNDLTVTGTVVADHPRIIYPSVAQVWSVIPAPTVVPAVDEGMFTGGLQPLAGGFD